MAKTAKSPLQSDMVQGTLDLLILQTLSAGPAHGHTIAHSIERDHRDVLGAVIQNVFVDLVGDSEDVIQRRGRESVPVRHA